MWKLMEIYTRVGGKVKKPQQKLKQFKQIEVDNKINYEKNSKKLKLKIKISKTSPKN